MHQSTDFGGRLSGRRRENTAGHHRGGRGTGQGTVRADLQLDQDGQQRIAGLFIVLLKKKMIRLVWL